MKAADLREAARLHAQLSSYKRLRERLAEREPLRLLLGEADKASEIVLSAAYLESIRKDVLAGFAGRIAEIEQSLLALGLEP